MKNVIGTLVLLCFGMNLIAQNQGDALRQFNLTEQQLRAHQLSLPNLGPIRSDENVELKTEEINAAKTRILKQFPVAGTANAVPAFDVNYFGPIVHNALKDNVMGYAYQVYNGNNAIYTGIWNWAKNPNDGDKGWTVDTRLHVASCSKLMTAIGLVKLLDKKNISLDASILPYLPNYWTKGNGVSGITFRKLLNHTSGLSGANSACDFPFMKSQIAMGPNVPAGTYANVNFSIMRVLITVIDGHLTTDKTWGFGLTDALWDAVCINYFQSYMNKEVFSLAGLPTIGFAPEVGGPTAKAYSSRTDPQGRDGNWATLAGGVGFYMSVGQILKTLSAFRNGTIMPAARAQYMLDNGLGNNGTYSTGIGKIHFRKGAWSVNDGEEQSVLYCLPNNVNIAVFINSPIKGYLDANGNPGHVHGLVYPAIQASIH